VGDDVGQFVEVAVDVNDDKTYFVSLYIGEGNIRTFYDSTSSIASTNTVGNITYNVYAFDDILDGLNGVALLSGGTVNEFLSYGGSFTANDGSASGTTSTNINVTESNLTTLATESLQRGIGTTMWFGPLQQTKAGPNIGASTPLTKAPTKAPTKRPTNAPTKAPTKSPTKVPTKGPTKRPTKNPTKAPTKRPTKAPTKSPTKAPTKAPSTAPVVAPTVCGLFGWNFFCPRRGQCGFIRRTLGWGGC
jgi:hypothetical protein